jgi:hypothetical protein
VTVTINAHQLGRLIEKTIGHMGSEYIEVLNGIRLDVDATHLYAVASDRYTIAAARHRLTDDDQGGEPFARTIPASYLRPLREWISTQAGQHLVTIGTGEGRLAFDAPQSGMTIPVTDSLEFPDWRGVLRNITQQPTDGEPFPAIRSEFLTRWADTGDTIRVRVTADQKAILLFGEDFIGAQMPARYAGVGPVKDETFESAQRLWEAALAAGADGVDMATAMPEEDPRSRYEVTKDVRETGEDLLRQTLHSSADMHGKSLDKPDEFLAHILAGVHAWMAYRFLDALYAADPRLAAATVGEVAEQLDSGEIGEFAWDAAEEAGHDPQKWHDDYEAHLKDRAAKKAAEAATANAA